MNNIEKIIKLSSDFTSHDSNFLQINRYLMPLYNGLNNESKISMSIVNKIFESKYYGTTTNKPNENKRIYNDKPFDPMDIAQDIFAIKYFDNDNRIKHDANNIRVKLKKLKLNNVYYIWDFYGSYIHIMERDFLCWKYYNPKGCVTPKIIKKIIFLHNDIINQMITFQKLKGRIISENKIKKSFALFLNQLIDKMNPSVSSSICKCNQGQDFNIYIRELENSIKQKGNFDGLECDYIDFVSRLPLTVRKSLEGKIMKDITDVKMIKAITPDGKAKNLGKRRRSRSKSKSPHLKRTSQTEPTKSNQANNPEKADIHNWGIYKTPDPLENAKGFVQYYRIQLQYYANQNLQNVNPQFANFSSDSKIASEILDVLRSTNKFNNVFVEEWIKYYCNNNLRGRKINKIKNTSLIEFKKTFDKFNQNFQVV